MGLDCTYRAYPADCRLIEMSKDHPQYGCFLEMIGFAQAAPDEIERRLSDAAFMAYVAEARRVREANPDITSRTVETERRWDMLHYLLSDSRRRCLPEDQSDIATRAIAGGPVIDERVYSLQGVPLRYLDPDGVSKVFEWMNNVQFDELERHWDPHAMFEAGVYKINPAHGPERLNLLLTDFSDLLELYANAASRNEGMLVILG